MPSPSAMKELVNGVNRYRHFINGQWVDSTVREWIEVENPATGAITPGERYLSLNDVTTRGMCVSKLGKVATDHGGRLAGMMVFARRDSGQFPLMDELTSTHPFYWSADLAMPQWEPADCPLCNDHQPLLKWKDLPEL